MCFSAPMSVCFFWCYLLLLVFVCSLLVVIDNLYMYVDLLGCEYTSLFLLNLVLNVSFLSYFPCVYSLVSMCKNVCSFFLCISFWTCMTSDHLIYCVPLIFILFTKPASLPLCFFFCVFDCAFVLPFVSSLSLYKIICICLFAAMLVCLCSFVCVYRCICWVD